MTNLSEGLIQNITFSNVPEFKYVTYQVHAISPVEIFIAVAGFALLSYYWIKVNKDKTHYEQWTNPKGRVVNLYKILKILMIIYPILVVALGFLQIYLSIIMN